MAGGIERLKAQGIGDNELARIHAPIGLDIGAISPPEIAVSIMGADHRAVAAIAGEGRMKFGPFAPTMRSAPPPCTRSARARWC